MTTARVNEVPLVTLYLCTLVSVFGAEVIGFSFDFSSCGVLLGMGLKLQPGKVLLNPVTPFVPGHLVMAGATEMLNVYSAHPFWWNSRSNYGVPNHAYTK